MADTPVSGAAKAIAAVAAPTTDAPAEQQAPQQDAASKAFAMKERQLHAERKALKAEREELQKKIAEYETGYVPKSRIKDDPYGVLEEAGTDYELLTKQLMEQPNDPVSRSMLQKLKKLEAQVTEAQSAASKAEEKQYNQAISQISNEAKMLIESDDRFETIKAKGMHEAVTELIKETFESEGVLMETEEACQKIEDYLIEEGMSFASLKKVKDRMAPKAAEVTEPVKPAQSQKPTITTLTNRTGSDVQPKGLTDKERRARAMAAFHGKLT